MMSQPPSLLVRAAVPEDHLVCASIKNAWIDATHWMPRVHAHDDVVRHYRDTVFPERRVVVAEEDVVVGYAVQDDVEVTALFVAKGARQRGVGAALLDHLKQGSDRLQLWTFVANEGARRFYAREGFVEVRRTAGDNEEGLPDVLLEWKGKP
jgi:GNAT superfamily N-acetyltransferase